MANLNSCNVRKDRQTDDIYCILEWVYARTTTTTHLPTFTYDLLLGIWAYVLRKCQKMLNIWKSKFCLSVFFPPFPETIRNKTPKAIKMIVPDIDKNA